MIFTDKIIKKPYFAVIYGADKVGKTTFVAQSKAALLEIESGSNNIDLSKFGSKRTQINSFEEVLNAIAWLRSEKHDFKSVGIDSLDHLEAYIWTSVCQEAEVKSIEEVGYGKGYVRALDYWRTLIAALEDLRDNRNMNIFAIAHSQTKTVNDPRYASSFDRHMMKLNEKAAALWREKADAILFACYEDVIVKSKGDKKGRAADSASGEVRRLYTSRKTAFDAGNRYGLPPYIALDYDAFCKAVEKGEPDSMQVVKDDLEDLMELLEAKDKPTAEKMKIAIEKNKLDLKELVRIRNYARELVGKTA